MEIVVSNLKDIDTTETKHVHAGYFAVAAARDAAFKNAVYKTRYTDKQQAKCNAMSYALEGVYSHRRIYVQYCKKWVRVKVENAKVINKKALRELESEWAEQGIVRNITKQGVTYRVKFNESH